MASLITWLVRLSVPWNRVWFRSGSGPFREIGTSDFSRRSCDAYSLLPHPKIIKKRSAGSVCISVAVKNLSSF